MSTLKYAAGLSLLLCAASPGMPKAQTLTDEEAANWLRSVTPLPKQVKLAGKVTVPISRLRVRLDGTASELDRCGVRELEQLLASSSRTDVSLSAPELGGTFAIDLVQTDTIPEVLAARPNRDQAYQIASEAPGIGHFRLRCAAETEVGTYYAVKTLKQLLKPTIRQNGDVWTVDLPIGTIIDWPDLEERGAWGGDCAQDLERLSDHKFNLIERHAKATVDANGIGHATMDMEVMERARNHAVRVVPIIHHLEQLGRSGLFKAYPNLRAKGAEKSICFAQPEIVTVVAQWLTDLGRIPDVSEVMIWLSEEGKGCTCTTCAKDDRFVNEVRVCVAAWIKAKDTCPGLGLRLLLTQASHKSNDKVLAAVPEGVKVSYYHGGLTYNTTRKPMIYPLLENYVKGGRWLGVYPTLGANWRIVAPFSNPWFVHFRLTEFVEDGLACLVGYTVPTNDLYKMNVEAAMEWAWNAGGRTPKAFARAYATRRGVRNVDAFVRWCERLSPVSWDVYGSGFPYREVYGGTDGIVRGSIKMGTGILAEFAREEQLDEDLASCAAALVLAHQAGDEAAVLETQIVQAYVQVLKSVWVLSKLVKKDSVAPENRDEAKRYFDLLQGSCSATASLYPKWVAAEAPELEKNQSARFWDTVAVMERLAARIGTVMEDCGFEDKEKPYRLNIIGTWATEEFEEQRGQTRRLDVTGLVDAPGTYTFQPKYRRGTLGLTASVVQLVSFPQDRPDAVRVESEDRHRCHAGAWVKDDIYRLELEAYAPDRGYAVVATIRGGPTTQGEFRFRKMRNETPTP
ncbi:MAG: hypothetical protein HN742_39040 [Lentisphaerae bacterium]|nr:hypothetical protein [Lentisphaerota bacterium]MBT4816010.1 hypothetical protein [Lentisphaerota bacterium]MBT5604533.1 hypothetical protein [Lentisphaerota bacterium]MBT7061928.1 hypothetical protein [Lentisphaerota bacterium]MBT7847928.1 hypothetical protein [Lentisphaerota bacterium]